MRHRPISSRLFVDNRQRLAARLGPNSLAVVNANDLLPSNLDGTTTYIPNTDLFHLTGIEQEQSILLLAPDAHDERQREILFLRQPNAHVAVWEGPKLTKEQARAISGLDRIEWLEDFRAHFHHLMCEMETVWLNSNTHPRAVVEVETRDARSIRETQRRYPLHTYRQLNRPMREIRLVKSAPEISLLRRAATITKEGYDRVMRYVRPGVHEYEVEAEFLHEFTRRRGRFGYQPIIASGSNACVLHYLSNDQVCAGGDLLLLDVGASYANYNADVTRTLPVNGKFTRRQRQVYNAVLRGLRHSVAGLKPGKLAKVWQKEGELFIEAELLKLGLLRPRDVRNQDPNQPALKKYFMHGMGHPLGLDVHDWTASSTPMTVGWVMTVEPGIYLPDEGFAVRLEDNIVLTLDGHLSLTRDIPIEPDAVEAAMRSRRASRPAFRRSVLRR